jgi:formate dehydrogenase major subunit
LLKEKAALERTPKNAAINALTWDLPTEGALAEPNAEAILAEINGWKCEDKSLLPTFEDLKADGSTASGCWVYSGVMPKPGFNRANQREPKDSLGHGWGFAWPKDTRVLYNRASARPDGEPWSEEKKFMWWDKQKREWTGKDIGDFKKDMPPDHKADLSKGGLEALDGDKPFGMHPDGRGWLYVSSGLKDGPLPAHFEPLESPIHNPIYPQQQTNPPAQKKERPDNPYANSINDARFPYILTTYRLTEHHTAGGMSRGLSHLAELQPELFVEISPELARAKAIAQNAWVTIVTPRAIISAKALVTARMRPLEIDGRIIHQVGLPYHWGWKGIVTGDVVNDLLAISQEPNVRIMETKGLVCNLVPGRRKEGKGALQQFKRLTREKA